MIFTLEAFLALPEAFLASVVAHLASLGEFLEEENSFSMQTPTTVLCPTVTELIKASAVLLHIKSTAGFCCS